MNVDQFSSCSSVADQTLPRHLPPHHLFTVIIAIMAGINAGDEKLIFESSESVQIAPTFEQLGLKEDLLRGIYAYSA